VNAASKGVLLGAIQLLLVLSLGGKLLYDRVTRPRVWVLCDAYDPDLPIRGRYLSEQLHMPAEGFTYKETNEPYPGESYVNRQWATLEIRNGQLIARQEGSGPGQWIFAHKNHDGTIIAILEEPVLIFVPDRAVIPDLKSGQEMWVEVTVPAKGPPRPIRIGIKKDGVLTPLKLD
jgi:hypothetical protein